jgi:hypothetical protein
VFVVPEIHFAVLPADYKERLSEVNGGKDFYRRGTQRLSTIPRSVSNYPSNISLSHFLTDKVR